MRLEIALALVVASSGGGCTPGPAPLDAAGDVPTDAPQPLFGLCTSNAPCMAVRSDAYCDLSYPGGLCTVACSDDTACGPRSHCLDGSCRPACTEFTGSLECDRYSGACGPVPNAVNSVCVPECYVVGVPAGWHGCAADAGCGYYNGACGAPAPSGMQVNGGPCTRDGDCAGGRCLPPVLDGGFLTGLLGGYCVSYGRHPPLDDYAMGQPIPQSNCPPGSAVLTGYIYEGDVGECWATCNTDSDCRPGYPCDHFMDPYTGARYYSNGLCRPLNCAFDPIHLPCPAGSACQMVAPTEAGVAEGRCVPVDGGADAAVDVVASP